MIFVFSPGRSIKLRVGRTYTSVLLRLAVEVGFDWVKYESGDCVRLSVIPDCELLFIR